MASTSYEHKTLTFTGGQANSTVVIATTAKRAFLDNIVIKTAGGGSSTPAITLNPTSLSGLTTTTGANSSAASYTVTGTNLGATNVTVTPNSSLIEISTNASTGFATNALTLTQTGGVVSNTVYVRIANVATATNFSTTIANVSGSVSTNLTVSGSVTAAGTPSVAVSPTSATGLTNYVGQPSATTNYTVTGTNLVSNLVVTASTNAIEVSTNSSTGFTNSFSLAPAGDGTLSNTVYVRISAAASAGAVNGSVSNVSGSASNNFTVSGTVTQPALTLVLNPTSVAENVGANASTGTVGIPFSLTNDLTVSLVSSNTAAATVPTTVTIPNGQTNATFAIAAVANTNSFANQTAVISASATGYAPASASLSVTNVDVPPAPLAAKGWINEFHYDNTGNDTGEFVEIVLAPGTATNNVSLILYNGSGGAGYATNALSTFTLGTTTNGYSIYSVSIPGIQNGSPDGFALIIDGLPEDLVSYEGTFLATDGAASGYNLPDIGIAETGSEAVGGSLYRYGPGTTGRDFAWAKATVATPGQPNANQALGETGVQGTGTVALANSTAASPLVGSGIFPRNATGQTISLTLTGTLTSGTISAMSVTVPSQFTGLTNTNQITVTGTGGAAASVGLSGQTVTVTGLAVDRVNTAILNIAGLTTPETAGSLANDGNYSFAVQTGTTGNLKSVLLPTTALVIIPIANLGDVDANGVTLDAGKTVAVQGVCTEENFNSSSSTSAYLQSGQPDGTNKAGINVYSGLRSLFVRGDEYVVAGSVLNYFGLTEVVVANANQVVNLGASSNQPTPVTLTIGQLTAAHEAYEGSLVRVTGLTKATNGGTWAFTTNTNGTVSGANITLQNGGTNLTARLNVGSTATNEPIYPAAITGIYGQFVATAPFVGGGQIQPRDVADVGDAPGLRLSMANLFLFESTNGPTGGSPTSGTLTVARTGGDNTAELVVALDFSPTGVLQGPATATIPAGQASTDVSVTAIDNSGYVAAGFTEVTVTASASGSGLVSASLKVTVLEDDASAPAGATFSGWSGGSATNGELVAKYGIGGATNATAASERPVALLESNVLSLTAIVRTNDLKLSVVGEAGDSLTNWSTNGVTSLASTNQGGVPDGCQRRVYSADRTNSPAKQFLRLKATLAP